MALHWIELESTYLGAITYKHSVLKLGGSDTWTIQKSLADADPFTLRQFYSYSCMGTAYASLRSSDNAVQI